jgi:hypothetical protein
MTISNSSAVPYKYSDHTHATAVPSEYSIQHPSAFSENHFLKPKPTQVKYGHSNHPWPRIGYPNRLHSAEVVHFTHNIR